MQDSITASKLSEERHKMEQSKKLFNFVSLGKTHDDIKKNLPFTDPCLDPLNVWTAYGFAVGLGQYYTYLIRPKWLGNNEPIAEHHTYFDAIMGLWFKGIWGYGGNRDEVFVRGFRKMCNYGYDLVQSHPAYEETMAQCNHTEIKVPTHHHGDYSVSVLVHTPKHLASRTKRPAIIYAHGGGVVGCSAATHQRFLSKMAVRCEVVVFNVDYRRPPETKCPNNILDFYEALKYISCHSDILGIDNTKIAIAGESGGGYICFGTMVLLSQRNESNIVKLAIPDIPMSDDDSFYLLNTGMINIVIKKLWTLIANDVEKQKNDPLLFPGKASDEIFANMPPIVLLEAEFDIFLAENKRLAKRLESAGRLLEYVEFPGQRHGSWINPRYECHETGFDAYSLIVQKYLIE